MGSDLGNVRNTKNVMMRCSATDWLKASPGFHAAFDKRCGGKQRLTFVATATSILSRCVRNFKGDLFRFLYIEVRFRVWNLCIFCIALLSFKLQ